MASQKSATRLTFPILGRLFKRAFTAILSPGLRLIMRSGRRERNVRRPLRPLLDEVPKADIIEMTTTTKSSQFHASLRYAEGCRIRPSEMIFKAISQKNINVKVLSIIPRITILDLIAQQAGVSPIIPESHGRKTLPNCAFTAERGQFISTACPAWAAAPEQLRNFGGGGQLLSEEMITSSGRSNISVIDDTRISSKINISTT
mmetsp:Transcript_56419/g.118000  ORF Transcript_56419/g.118000 Transcript_56419/m.118000 type:complete len:203 (+) Transcript_56419:664-1272(+)